MFLRERDFDSIFERANAKYGLQVPLLKAIAATESGFENKKEQPKYGIMGLTIDIANAVAKSLYGENAPKVSISDMMDAEVNIILAAHYIRLLFNRLDNPDSFDVVREYARANVSTRDLSGYVNTWFKHFRYYCDANTVHSISPREVEGVWLRRYK